MVASPSDYRWSSHKGNSGLAPNALLTPHPEYQALAVDERARHAAYQCLFTTGDDPAFLIAIRDATNGGFALVSEQLKCMLPAGTRKRLERRPSGPAARAASGTDTALSQLEFELGLRPRTS
jgi:putative transposase